LRPTLRGQPELLTGRSAKDPGAAGTLSPGPRICRIDRPPSQTAPRSHRPTQPGTQRRHRRSGPRRSEASHGSRCTQRLCWFRSRPTAKRHSGPRPCHRGRSSRGYLLRTVRAASAGVFSSHILPDDYCLHPPGGTAGWVRTYRGVLRASGAKLRARSCWLLPGSVVRVRESGPGSSPATSSTGTAPARLWVRRMHGYGFRYRGNDAGRDGVVRACGVLRVPWYGPTFGC